MVQNLINSFIIEIYNWISGRWARVFRSFPYNWTTFAPPPLLLNRVFKWTQKKFMSIRVKRNNVWPYPPHFYSYSSISQLVQRYGNFMPFLASITVIKESEYIHRGSYFLNHFEIDKIFISPFSRFFQFSYIHYLFCIQRLFPRFLHNIITNIRHDIYCNVSRYFMN